MGVFDSYKDEVWPFVYDAVIQVNHMHGGRPQDPRVVEGWIGSKIKTQPERLRQLVDEAIDALGFTPEDLDNPDRLAKVLTEAARKKLNGFYRMPDGQLAVEGRHIKAMLKEATNIAYPWVDGVKYKGKSMKNTVAEHVFVLEDYIPLGIREPDGIDVRFAPGSNGQRSITREEYVEAATVAFTLTTDLDWKEEIWAKIFLTGQLQGFGTARSQGYGTFEVTKFDLRK